MCTLLVYCTIVHDLNIKENWLTNISQVETLWPFKHHSGFTEIIMVNMISTRIDRSVNNGHGHMTLETPRT